ncbi:MAG: gamma-glutamyl-gamma-aminobutyrate hydrolase family protein [Nitrospirota bacterium]
MARGRVGGADIAVLVKSREPKVLRDVAPYLRWVARGGGRPVVVLLGRRVPASASGVLLVGGEDVAPARYGETDRHCERINEPRDAWELDLLPRALERDVPIFAVCRGVQVLAVALGGALVQDLPAELGRRGIRSRVIHRGPAHTDSAHRIRIVPRTLLARLIPTKTALVNSHHHQAVRAAPRGLLVSARASDGTIEAVEHATNRFVLGVQWHPERWPHPSSAALVRGFLEACAGE